MNERIFSNISESNDFYLKGLPIKSNKQKSGNDYFEVPSRAVIITNTNSKKEYLLVGFLLDVSGEQREIIVIKDNISDVLEIPIGQFDHSYRIHKVYREGVSPELIYLNGVPDKITSGQHWVPKNNEQVDTFGYASRNQYVSEEIPSQVWEVQSVVGEEVTLNLIQQEDHNSGFKDRVNTHQILKLTKLDLVTNYRLHTHGFHLSNEFYKFIDQETYVSQENKDKIYMMVHGRSGEFVKIDELVGPSKIKQEIKIELK